MEHACFLNFFNIIEGEKKKMFCKLIDTYCEEKSWYGRGGFIIFHVRFIVNFDKRNESCLSIG